MVIGKNSSVFLLVKRRLLCQIEFLEVESKQAKNYFREEKLDQGQCCIIFSGVVTDDVNRLIEIESFHSSLAKELSDAEARVILISSSAVYGSYKHIFSEIDECRPISNYGRSKLKIEQIYLSALTENVSILRLGNVLGLDTVSKAFSASDECDRYLDCRHDYSTPMRTYVDTQILSDIIIRYCENFGDLPQKLNIGRKKPQAMHHALQEIGINFNFNKTKTVSKDLTLDTSQLFKILC